MVHCLNLRSFFHLSVYVSGRSVYMNIVIFIFLAVLCLSSVFLLLFLKISFLSSLLVLSVSYSFSPFPSPFTLVYLSLSILFPHTFSGCPAASTGASVDVLTTNLNSRRQEKSSVLFTTRGSLYNITEFLIVNVPPKT